MLIERVIVEPDNEAVKYATLLVAQTELELAYTIPQLPRVQLGPFATVMKSLSDGVFVAPAILELPSFCQKLSTVYPGYDV